jgi:hypothetical protein
VKAKTWRQFQRLHKAVEAGEYGRAARWVRRLRVDHPTGPQYEGDWPACRNAWLAYLTRKHSRERVGRPEATDRPTPEEVHDALVAYWAGHPGAEVTVAVESVAGQFCTSSDTVRRRLRILDKKPSDLQK